MVTAGAILAAFLLSLAVHPPPATAQSFLDIADSIRDKPVPRPSPNSVPEFILIAEMANRNNRRTTPRTPGGVPDFVLIGESFNNRRTTTKAPGGVPDFVLIGESVHNKGDHPTTSMFEMPSQKPSQTTPLPPEITTAPDLVDFNEFTSPTPEEVTPAQLQESTTEMEMIPENVVSSTEDSQMTTEDFDEDKIYFEEWDKKVGDPR